MRKPSSFVSIALLVAASFAALPTISQAQDDPPGRVARLNYIQGSVSYQVSGDTDWVDADPNRPLTTGDNLWADKDSRGEVHIGSTAIRLASETGISFLNLDDRTVQMELPQGTIEVHLRNHLPGDAFEIDTPNLAFTITHAGEYLIAVDPNGNSTVIVIREGEGEITGGGESHDLGPGQQYIFTGTDQLTYDSGPAPGVDDFEAWCEARDQTENNAVSAQYVSRDVDGYYDLDANGNWETDEDYGEVWFPTGVAADWAPYHRGHWVWIMPWRWTWVPEEPWGFATCHYGRWAFVRGRWGWVPGPMVVRPVYAPALVAFVGGHGPGFGISAEFRPGFDGVGWFPLGPHDVFVPGYHASPRYVQYINITNTKLVKVNDVNMFTSGHGSENFMYAHNGAAVTVVSRDTFVNAHRVDKEEVRVTPEEIAGARTVGSTPLAPTRESFVSASARISEAKPAKPFSERPVVARLNPPAPASRQVPEYTNDSRPFYHPPQPADENHEQPEAQGNNPAGGNNAGAGNSSAATVSRPGFQNFHPRSQPENSAPADNRGTTHGENGAMTHGNAAANESVARPQNEERPAVKYAAPVRAREDMYDIHPPLNQKPAEPAKSSSESHTESHSESHSDSHGNSGSSGGSRNR